MSKRITIEDIIFESEYGDRKYARALRTQYAEKLIKLAEAGILQDGAGSVADYETREHYPSMRGGKVDTKDLYGVGIPEHKAVDLSTKVYNRSLSTRYSPDRVGVQARRVSDGVYQDPITNKTYDWNEGFTTDDGSKFSGGNVSLQTDIIYRE
jgi:hypothetical protein